MNKISFAKKVGIGILAMSAFLCAIPMVEAALNVEVYGTADPVDSTAVRFNARFAGINPDVPVTFDSAKVFVMYDDATGTIMGGESGVTVKQIATYNQGDPIPFIKDLPDGGFIYGNTYYYRFRTEFYQNGNLTSTMYYPIGTQSPLVFTAVPVQIADENISVKAIDAVIELKTNQVNITLQGTNPVIPGNIEVTLTGGSNQNNLSLFGGVHTVPAGTTLPTSFAFPITNTLSPGGEYYIRMYADGGNTHLVYPGATQQPLRIFVGQTNIEAEAPGVTAVGSGPADPNTAEQETQSPSASVSGGGLVPCGNRGQAMCGFNDIMTLISNLINYMFLAIVPITAIAFIIIGTQYMLSQGNVELKVLLKNRLGNLLLGIVLVLGAWLLMATILRSLGVNDAYILLDL